MKNIVAAALMLFILPACAKGPDTLKETRELMGTFVTITAVRGELPEIVLRKAVKDAFAEVERVDRLMSTYKPDSQVSEINRMAGVSPVSVDPEVAATVNKALEVAEMTQGGFDPTVGPVVRLWGIGGEDEKVPAVTEINAALLLIDYSQVEVDGEKGTVFIRRKGMSIDLGGIAKGYAADRAVEVLKTAGVPGGIVAVAGDLKLFGRRPDESLWSIGVQHPRNANQLLVKLELTDAATSTSGDYERYFIKNSASYHHILDPATGYPAMGLVSVTVLAKESYLADSLATGLFVMGERKAHEFAASHPEIEVLMVTSDGDILATGRFKGLGIGRIEVGELE